MKPKYAIKVMLSKDDWIYVTKPGDVNPFEVSPVLFNTRQEAEEYAKIWGIHKVVKYKEEQ